ncbi:MAG: Hg(II)-responsive transcriptional regulator [bacterium]
MAREEKQRAGMTIGELADRAGVNIETVRYYQRRGLIEEPPKPLNGFRRYPVATVERLWFIKRAQSLGFSLGEIADLLQLGQGHCKDMRQRAEEKREKIHRQIQDLKRLEQTLDGLIASCQEGDAQAACPIVESLLDHKPLL